MRNCVFLASAATLEMSISVGRLMSDRVLDRRFVAFSHNTIRGAAGAAIFNAELLMPPDIFSRETLKLPARRQREN